MANFSALLAFVALASTASSLPSVDSRVRRHALDNIPRGWDVHSVDTPPELEVTLHIGLKQPSFDTLVSHLYEVSDPEHHRYGQYLSKEEVEDLVRPDDTSVEAIYKWLHSAGVDLSTVQRAPAKDWVSITVPVSLAEELVGAKYNTFRHRASGRTVVRTLEYSVPKSLDEHIDLIQPTTYFGTSDISPPVAMKRRDVQAKPLPQVSVPQSCNDPDFFVTPACMADFYHFSNYTPKSTDKNKVGVALYLGSFIKDSDLQQYLQSYRPDAVNTTFTLFNVTGQTTFSDSEADLDVETVVALTHPTPVDVYSVGNAAEPNNTNEAFLSWALFTLNQTDPPSVISTSFADTDSEIPFDYANRLCNTIAQLGARGISIIFGSGDGGVDNSGCTDVTNSTVFQPSFPGGCPFITSVGGTENFNPERAVGGPNSTANYRGSGAGFSNYFPRPKYQDKAVSTYLKKLGSQYAGLFNTSGRAFPDIAAQSSNFPIIQDGELWADSGTSASGPLVASIIALLNDYRLSIGKPPLGFLNPWLYSKGFEGLNDILIGQSEGCNGRGFDAAPGWDPVTGLGTPDFLKLQKLVKF